MMIFGVGGAIAAGLFFANQPGGPLDWRDDRQKNFDINAELQQRGLCYQHVSQSRLTRWEAAGKFRPRPGRYYVPCGFQSTYAPETPPAGTKCFHSDISNGRLIEWPCPGR